MGFDRHNRLCCKWGEGEIEACLLCSASEVGKPSIAHGFDCSLRSSRLADHTEA